MGKINENKKSKALLTLKPHMSNALIPLFIRNLVYSFIIVTGFYGLIYLTQIIGVFHIVTFNAMEFYLIFLISLFLVAFIPLSWKIIILYNTQYFLFSDRIEKNFELLVVRTKSVNYDKIIDITIDISIWDRICRSGDIIFHTAEDKSPELKMSFIKHPERVEDLIYTIIQKNKNNPNFIIGNGKVKLNNKE